VPVLPAFTSTLVLLRVEPYTLVLFVVEPGVTYVLLVVEPGVTYVLLVVEPGAT